MAVSSMHLGVWSCARQSPELQTECQNGKERWFNGCWCLSISQSAQLLGFSHTSISRVYKECCEKGKTSSMWWQSCGPKCLVDARGQRRMGRLIQADRRATLTEISTHYNRGMQQRHNTHNLEQQKTPPGTTHLLYK